MHANWWHQRKWCSSEKVIMRWAKAASVCRSYLLSLISVAFPADRERCIRRQKGARWGGGACWRVKTGEVDRPKASGKTDDFGPGSCTVFVTGQKWPENKMLVGPVSAPPPPTHVNLDPSHRANKHFWPLFWWGHWDSSYSKDLSKGKDTTVTTQHLKTFTSQNVSFPVLLHNSLEGGKKYKPVWQLWKYLRCNEKFSLMRQLCWSDPVLHLIIVAF